jgi:predicted transcriptional regulator
MLNLAVPVAAVLTDGERVWPDKLATKLDYCANPDIDIDIKDRTKMASDIIEVYLPTGNFVDCIIFVDFHLYNRVNL